MCVLCPPFENCPITADHAKLPINHTYLVKKRVNLPFKMLIIDFGMAPSTDCRIFTISLPIIATVTQNLIWWPEVY